MPAEGYPQKLKRRHGGLDLAAVRRDAVDWIWKERVLRCHEMIQEKITMGSIILKSAGSSIFPVPQSPIGVLDAAACLSQQSDDATVGSPATCYHSSSTSKRRRITRRLL
ncbi:hypothetical protein C2845_PM12G27720 [Panicum miliaceum]|uniref:Uncharacterized protein n=1 Tax=Panicum miliaceum TaxID=4540 RepID=A0A3L6QEV7_PANMI|nr:hypothetical protein C2845_PM12G27720 [Panicum miliaceum]